MLCRFAYHDLVSRAVVSSKYATRTGLIRSFAAEMHAMWIQADIPPPDCVTFVPSHHWRRLVRGGCSAAVLAGDLARRVRLPCRRLATVTRRIAKQSKLPDDQRELNVRGAFRIRRRHRRSIGEKHIVLVDDVITTGSTTRQIAEQLRDAGAARVTVMSIARTIRR